MILQLEPTLPLMTPKGPGYAHFLIEHGDEHYLQFVCFIDETGECWKFNNPDIRLQYNTTMGRPPPKGKESFTQEMLDEVVRTAQTASVCGLGTNAHQEHIERLKSSGWH